MMLLFGGVVDLQVETTALLLSNQHNLNYFLKLKLIEYFVILSKINLSFVMCQSSKMPIYLSLLNLFRYKQSPVVL